MMTERQAAKLAFSFYRLPNWGTPEWGFEKLRKASSDRAFTKAQASELIDWLLMLENPKHSPAYRKALTLIQAFQNTL